MVFLSDINMLLQTDEILANENRISLTSSRKRLAEASKDIPLTYYNASELRGMSDVLPSPLGKLNECLAGGFRPGQLFELVGEAGSGKTQFCMHMAAIALHSAMTVYWIDTESTLRPERLISIMQYISVDSLEALHVAKCSSLSDLVNLVRTLGETILSRRERVLLIVDSVAGVARSGLQHISTRQAALHELAVLIKQLNVVSIVTNHVIANLQTEKTGSCDAALGVTWSHAVNGRLFLRVHETLPMVGRKSRAIDVIKAPAGMSESSIGFEITSTGINSI